MTRNYESHDAPQKPNLRRSGAQNGNKPNLSLVPINSVPNDLTRGDRRAAERFESLSAYLDGELNSRDAEQVERWLETEPQMQQSYQQLVKLRAGVNDMPVPISDEPVEEFVAQVFSRIDA
ncbi:anti-sigma factor family protein, partial [Phormidium sp. CCY1219]|uniref:anti-sigma factor family protein n=1 Tax=Phormidium sp. CCY1219 TaxID=2886104 RepID=UPI002D1F6932|nr:hypothetical protein [Phormidium sp. CCY1219]